MSNLGGSVKVVGMNDGLSNFEEIVTPMSTVMIANDKFNPRVFTATSKSNESLMFSSIGVPNKETFVDKLMLIKTTVTIAFSGKTAAVGQRLLQTGFDALRAVPLNSSISTATLSINGSEFSNRPFMYAKELMRFNRGEKDLNIDFSGTASMLDNTQEYAETANTLRNPLAKWADNPYLVPRGGAVEYRNIVNPITVSLGDLLNASITFDIVEPLLLSPCVFSTTKRTGFYGIESMNVDLKLANLKKRFWSHNPANTTQFDVDDVNIDYAAIQLMFASPQTSEKKRAANKGFVYPYYRPVPFNTSVASLASNASTTLQSSVCSFSSIPHSVFIWVKERDSDKNIERSDAYLRINKLSLVFGNSATQFDQATPYQLYTMAVRNGYSGTYQDWSGAIRYECIGGTESKVVGIGSIACFQFGSDIPLGPDEAPGLAGQYTFQATLDITNINQSRAIISDIVVMPVYEGAVSITKEGTSVNIATVTSKDIEAVNKPKAIRIPPNMDNYIGGSKVGDWFKKAGSFIWKYVIPIVGPLLGSIALGGSNSNVGGKIISGGGVGVAGSKVQEKRLKDFFTGGAVLGPADFRKAMRS